MKKSLFTLFALFSAAAFASAFTFSDIQNWTGTGSNEAALVIDFEDGSTYPAFVWGFRWDGTATGEQMVDAIVAADPNLADHVTSYSFGDSLDEFTYDGTAFGLGYHDEVGFGANSQGYWAYYLGNGESMPTSTTWVSSQVGFSDYTLTNEDWQGWSWAPNFQEVPPTQNVIAAPQAVPTPAGILILGFAGIGFALLRRKH